MKYSFLKENSNYNNKNNNFKINKKNLFEYDQFADDDEYDDEPENIDIEVAKLIDYKLKNADELIDILNDKNISLDEKKDYIKVNKDLLNKNNAPMLYYARHDLELVKLLLEYGADVNAITDDGWTILMWACRQNNLELIKLLIEYGVDINFKSRYGNTAIAFSDNKEVVDYLLKNGAIIGYAIFPFIENIKFTDNEIINFIENENLYNIRYNRNGTTNLLGAVYGLYRKNKTRKDVLIFLLKSNETHVNFDIISGYDALPFLIGLYRSKEFDFLKYILNRDNVEDINLNARDNYGYTLLQLSIGDSNVEIAKELIKIPTFDVNWREDGGLTALMFAAKELNKEIVELLLDRPDIDVFISLSGRWKNKGWTAFDIARYFENRNGDTEHVISNLILEKMEEKSNNEISSTIDIFDAIENNNYIAVLNILNKNYINITNDLDQTPLMLSIDKDYESIAELLIRFGADINKKCYSKVLNKKCTPLYACLSIFGNTGADNLPIIKLLLLKTESINYEIINLIAKEYLVQNRNGDFVFYNNSFEGIADLVLDKNIDTVKLKNTKKFNESINAIIMAYINLIKNNKSEATKELFKKNLSHIKKLISMSSDINVLINAVECNLLEICKLLIKAGADVNKTNKEGKSPLAIAIDKKYNDIIKFLLKQNIDFDSLKNQNVLSESIRTGNVNLAKLFINNNIGINEQNSGGYTPLYWTIKVIDDEKIKYSLLKSLLEHGADPNICNFNDKKNALLYAIDHFRNSQIAQINILKLLLKYGIDVNHKDIWGRSALWYVLCWHQGTSIADLLLKNGANINSVDEDGNTILLSYFSKSKYDYDFNIKTVEYLIKNGANVNAKSNEGKTALWYAIEEHNECIELLLENNADPNIKDYKGNTVLHDAVRNKNIDLIKLLIKYNADPNITNNNNKSPLDLAKTKEIRNILLKKD